jgi:hypothetical protein
MTQRQRIADGSVRIREYAPAYPVADDWRATSLTRGPTARSCST